MNPIYLKDSTPLTYLSQHASMPYHHTIMDEIRSTSTSNHTWEKTHHHMQPYMGKDFYFIILIIFNIYFTTTHNQIQ